jgi:hypothetical protein
MLLWFAGYGTEESWSVFLPGGLMQLIPTKVPLPSVQALIIKQRWRLFFSDGKVSRIHHLFSTLI